MRRALGKAVGGTFLALAESLPGHRVAAGACWVEPQHAALVHAACRVGELAQQRRGQGVPRKISTGAQEAADIHQRRRRDAAPSVANPDGARERCGQWTLACSIRRSCHGLLKNKQQAAAQAVEKMAKQIKDVKVSCTDAEAAGQVHKDVAEDSDLFLSSRAQAF